MTRRPVLFDHPDYRLYDFGPHHPFRPERIDAGLSLLTAIGRLDPRCVVRPAVAELAELELTHDPAYIRAVDEAGSTGLPSGALFGYGLSSSDNPPFPDMHYAASLVVGGTVEATAEVMSGAAVHAFNPAGGLHHAHRSRASGFCIYNDAAIAIATVLRDFDARVLYLDFDCHHGDGVQWLFYDDPRVLTVSWHESGHYLFPGTGEVSETGEGAGEGFCLNLPFHPFTEDSSWMESLEVALPLVAEKFLPDLIVSNHGCDTHVWDPLTHLSLTTASLERQARKVHELAHTCCAGRWVAVGSGGYDWRRVVPRSWTILWCEMTDQPVPDSLPEDWATRWLANEEYLPSLAFQDTPEIVPAFTRADEVRAWNRRTLDAVLTLAET